MKTLCQQIMTPSSLLLLIVDLEQSGIRIPDAQSIILTFSIIGTFYLTKTENKTKTTLT